MAQWTNAKFQALEAHQNQLKKVEIPGTRNLFCHQMLRTVSLNKMETLPIIRRLCKVQIIDGWWWCKTTWKPSRRTKHGNLLPPLEAKPFRNKRVQKIGDDSSDQAKTACARSWLNDMLRKRVLISMRYLRQLFDLSICVPWLCVPNLWVFGS